jgi:hypothetical protein
MARFLTLLHRCALAALIALGPLAAVAQPPKPAYVSGSITTGALTKFAGPQSVTTGNLSGDCTTSGSLAVICLKTNGVNFAYFATGTDASNLTGTVAGARLSGSYTGITGLGTVTAGTWNGTVIGSAYGGAGSVTGLLKANGSGTVSAATSGTDYQGPITLTTTGSSGAATFSGNTLNIPQYSGGGAGGSFYKSTQTISSAVSSITFTVPSGYNNLQIALIARTSSAVAFDRLCMQFNADTGSNYLTESMNFTPSNTFAAFWGNAGAAYGTPGQENLLSMPGANALSNAFGQAFFDIPTYGGTTALKTAFVRGGGILSATVGGLDVGYNAQLFWNNTTAVTSITLLFAGGGNFVAGSEVTLTAF